MSENVLEISDDNFEQEVIKADKPVLVDFWASWCGPCKMIAPTIEELAKEFDGKFKFTKLNVDDNQKTAANYGVQSIPTLIFFKNGENVEQIIGMTAKTKLEEKINKILEQ